MGSRGERGAASVEHISLVLLLASLLLGMIAALAAAPGEGGRELGSALARKLRCAAALPGPCWRDPLTEAYGRPLAGVVRALAPPPAPATTPGGTALVPVDFRYCRQESCAVPADPTGTLTESGRRTTAFTSLLDRRRSGGGIEVTYWLYRPRLGWSSLVRSASAGEVDLLGSTPLPETASPRLVPLETLPGRNHYEFAAAEEPPWRWRVPGAS
jgi:hypothetical protein